MFRVSLNQLSHNCVFKVLGCTIIFLTKIGSTFLSKDAYSKLTIGSTGTPTAPCLSCVVVLSVVVMLPRIVASTRRQVNRALYYLMKIAENTLKNY